MSNNTIIKKYINIIKGYKYKKDYLDKEQQIFFRKKIGLFDPLGENVNPLTLRPYENLYSNLIMTYDDGPLKGVAVPVTYKNLAYNWTHYKVYENTLDILDSIRNNQITMLKAGTGTGKTVIAPKIALHAFNFQKKIVCTVPKHVIAKDAAEYAAKCLDVQIGNEVGYYYMGSNKTTDKTMLSFTTPGSLKSKITGSDPYLYEYDCILIDEVHERSVETDQLMLLIKNILIKRPEFRVVAISATIDLEHFKDYFTVKSNFKYKEIEVEGKAFNVDIYYEKEPIKDWINAAANKIVHILKTSESGDILVFITAGGDGRKICDDLQRQTKSLPGINPFCVILEAKGSPELHSYAINEVKYKSHPNMDVSNPYTRKVVMATNVAESSLTVKGIVYVIDSGFSYESAFYPKESANSLLVERISKASATQRKGRAGRTQSGFCYRLYTENEFNNFKDWPVPAIQKTDITSSILDMFLLDYIKNVGDVKNYLNLLIDPPTNDFIFGSLNKLYALEAINNINDDGQITVLGRSIAKFRGLEANYAKCILASYFYHCKNEVVDIISIADELQGRMDYLFDRYSPRNKKMSESEMKKDQLEYERKQNKFHSSYGDYITILNVYQSLKKYMKVNSNQPILENVSGLMRPMGPNAKDWCRDNGISQRIFINRNTKKGGWDKIALKSRKINDTLMKIIRPSQLKLEHFNAYRNDGGRDNINKIKRDIEYERKIIVDADDAKNIFNGGALNVEIDVPRQNRVWTKKIYEIDLFKNIANQGGRIDNILMSFAMGNICNFAKLFDSRKSLYKTCFPIQKSIANLSRDTTLTSKVKPPIVIYHELFILQRQIKLNLTTMIPDKIVEQIKNRYRDFILTCFQKEDPKKIIDEKMGQKGQKVKKGKMGQKFQKKNVYNIRAKKDKRTK